MATVLLYRSAIRATCRTLCLAASVMTFVSAARAERQHTVREGQSLISIAHGYDVSVSSLAAANERRADTPLQIGEVLSVPEKGVVYLASGESLWTVARRHGCTVEALARASGIGVGTSLRPGARLVLPGARAKPGTSAKLAASPGKTPNQKPETVPRSVASGSVALYRVATQERLKLTLTDPQGRVRPQAATRMAKFLRPRNSSKQKRPALRLLAHLAEISRHYEGRPIQVMSGYRLPGGFTSRESRHTEGAAMDIRVEGVDNRKLCDYLRHFRNVGVGFYPHSSFVHFDVREKNAYWIDLSSAGRKPSYLDREQRDHFDGKNKDEGLVELGKSVEALFERDEHGEPAETDPKAADE
jgi:uncharacterized protein YcbK (DUF882 family)